MSYGIARFGNDLSVLESRTTATLVLVAVGLWVLVLQARPFNWWKTLLVGGDGRLRRRHHGRARGCATSTRSKLPPRDVVVEGAIVAGAAIALLEIGWRFSRVIGSRRNFDEVVDDDHADEEAMAG